MDPSIQHFETFIIVAEQKSFSEAAKILGISRAAVSQSIRLLEKSLELPLFIRTTRQVQLTDEGELLLAQCQRLKHELDLARDLVNGFKTSPTGLLRISCNPFFAKTKLISILQQYTRKFPQVDIEICTHERMPNMQQEQVDIVFGVNWPAPDDVVAKVISNTRYVLCASPSYLQKHGTPKHIKDLEQHLYIAHLNRGPKNLLVSLKKAASIKLQSKLKSDSAVFMKQCATADLGIIQVHDYMVQDELQAGDLVEVLPEFFKTDIPIYIYYQKHKFVQPKIRQFINFLL